MITIGRFSKPEEAHLFRTRLEAGGVPAYVLDENTVQMQWLYSNALGGVRVQIAEKDMNDAREIMAEAPQETSDAIYPACPKCSSRHTAPDETPRRISYLLLLVLGFPILFSKSWWKCSDCGNAWKLRQ